MATNNITTSKKDIKTIRAAFKAYKRTQKPIANREATIDPGLFFCHAVRVNELLDALMDVEMVWGSENINFDRLTEVFKVYTKHRPYESADTLSLFSTLFALVASILEHREYLYTLSQQYQFVTNQMDQMKDGRDFNEVIFPEFYPERPPVVN